MQREKETRSSGPMMDKSGAWENQALRKSHSQGTCKAVLEIVMKK